MLIPVTCSESYYSKSSLPALIEGNRILARSHERHGRHRREIKVKSSGIKTPTAICTILHNFWDANQITDDQELKSGEKRVCGQMGVTKTAGIEGATIEPPALIEYAVLPEGVEIVVHPPEVGNEFVSDVSSIQAGWSSPTPNCYLIQDKIRCNGLSFS